MEATLTINNILSEARKLSKEEQLTLLQRLMLLLKKPKPAATDAVRLSALSGVGSELWGDASAIDAYLDDERQW